MSTLLEHSTQLHEKQIAAIIRLRLVVGVLGQRSRCRWWDCDFLSPSGLEALDYNFPRAPLRAAFTATCLAAKRLHDERIGRTGVTHLFRLDPDLEILVQRAGSDALQGLQGLCGQEGPTLMAELAEMAGEEIDSPEGPVQVGVLKDAYSPAGLAQLARHYHAGFRLNLHIFPYFAAKRA